ncbi:hypothetical protein [Vitiosangium sp. GDMCC 1.1324]|uniref:hypothetical protein n=1 Tax=Vitiosangium sp. (strain GDMCC 1.1324) TaxID=2138576 RepID=UPI000D3BAD61|nr:hypothetical protein [Vitiosangium sp. GDMCC 1.1324]PTL76106.1 hypothetical protein DAT35_50955 [Vitiosangium sp. GDMCC 1.1324]
MSADVQPRQSKRVALLLGAVFLSCLMTMGLGIRWVLSTAKSMRSPAATTAKQFVEALAAGDRPRALQSCDSSELTEAKVLELERQSADLLVNRAWSVTYAQEFSDQGTEAFAVFLVPKLPEGQKASRAFIVDMVNQGGWKVRRLHEVDPEDHKVSVSF